MNLVMCTWCEAVSTEQELEVIVENEHCPHCKKTGHLLDVEGTK